MIKIHEGVSNIHTGTICEWHLCTPAEFDELSGGWRNTKGEGDENRITYFSGGRHRGRVHSGRHIVYTYSDGK